MGNYKPFSAPRTSAPSPRVTLPTSSTTVSASLGEVKDSLLGSFQRGGTTAAADQVNQELVETILAQVAPELADDPRVKTFARLLLPTLLVGLTAQYPQLFQGYEDSVKAAAELANDATFRDVIQPYLPSLKGLVAKFAGTVGGPRLAVVGE